MYPYNRTSLEVWGIKRMRKFNTRHSRDHEPRGPGDPPGDRGEGVRGAPRAVRRGGERVRRVRGVRRIPRPPDLRGVGFLPDALEGRAQRARPGDPPPVRDDTHRTP